MKTVFTGKAWTFGDNVNTESIMPTGTDLDPALAVGKVLSFYDSEFPKKVQPGDIIVAGRNFGNSSSRPAGQVLKYVGIAAVICESSARIFFRNTWNIGVPVLECPGITAKVKKGDQIEVDIKTGRIKNLETNEVIQAEPAIGLLIERWEAGGMLEWIKARKNQYSTIEQE